MCKGKSSVDSDAESCNSMVLLCTKVRQNVLEPLPPLQSNFQHHWKAHLFTL